MPVTKATRISNTVEFFPAPDCNPTPSPAVKIGMILDDLLDAVLNPIPSITGLTFNDDVTAAVWRLQWLLCRDASGRQQYVSPTKLPAPSPVDAPTIVPRRTSKRDVTRVGTKVRRRFADGVYHDGTVQSFDSKNKLYLVKYDNGDGDELTSDELCIY